MFTLTGCYTIKKLPPLIPIADSIRQSQDITRLCTAINDEELDGKYEILRAVFLDLPPTVIDEIDHTRHLPEYHFSIEAVLNDEVAQYQINWCRENK